MLAITFGWSLSFLGIPAAPVASFVGSLLAVGIVYALASARHRGLSTNVLLLAGVITFYVGGFFEAFLAALVISLVSMVLNRFTSGKRRS